jgi:hypothetical protein
MAKGLAREIRTGLFAAIGSHLEWGNRPHCLSMADRVIFAAAQQLRIYSVREAAVCSPHACLSNSRASARDRGRSACRQTGLGLY